MAEWVIQAQSISKAYGGKTLFQGVDLDIPRGRAIAFIGHNGTGKTTLLKVLAGLVAPSAGRVVQAKGVSVGYVPEHFPRMNLTALQYLCAMGGIEGLSGAEAAERSLALLRDFFMDGMANVPMKHLSKGSLQKVGVAQALLRTPDVLLLDEPLSGQDLDSQRVFVGKVKALIQGGTTVLLSCHEPFLVRRLADQVYEIEGKRLAERSPEDVRFTDRVFLTFACDPAVQTLPRLEGCEVEAVDGGLKVTAPTAFCDAVLLSLLNQGLRLREMRHENDD